MTLVSISEGGEREESHDLSNFGSNGINFKNHSSIPLNMNRRFQSRKTVGLTSVGVLMLIVKPYVNVS